MGAAPPPRSTSTPEAVCDTDAELRGVQSRVAFDPERARRNEGKGALDEDEVSLEEFEASLDGVEAELEDLGWVEASLHYLAPDDRWERQAPESDRVHVRVHPPSSGIATVRPPSVGVRVRIYDGRPIASELELDVQGFELYEHRSVFADYYDAAAVERRYYPEVRDVLRLLTGARDVIVFDHNVRSSVRANRGQLGVSEPVAQVHNDYTIGSGPRRKLQILKAAGRLDLADRHVAFINLWRPIIGPVLDNPLALCAATSVLAEDLVETQIQHFGEEDARVPRHTGEIYSVRHSPRHRWLYFPAMRRDEILLFKGYDARADGRARFVPHTGFEHPDCPPHARPRESIEARALVIFD
jgi:hypothetical protein